MPIFTEFADVYEDDDASMGLLPAWMLGSSATAKAEVKPAVRLPDLPGPPKPTSAATAVADKISSLTKRPPQVSGNKVYVTTPATQWPRIIQWAAAFTKEQGKVLRVVIADTELPWEGRSSIPITLEVLEYGQ